MTIAEMLQQSGLLTLLGMGVVFSFLIILIVCMYALHGVLHLFGKDKEETTASTGTSAPAPAAQTADEGEIVAAIAAAIHDKQLNS